MYNKACVTDVKLFVEFLYASNNFHMSVRKLSTLDKF